MLRASVLLLTIVAGCTYDFDSYLPGTDPPVDSGVSADAASDATSDAPVTCADGWRAFERHCYFALSGARDFDQSRAACDALGSHLVTVTSAEEQAFVQALGSGERWIGLRKTAGTFVWITGETSSYARWGMGEPNGTGDCARLRSTNDWGDQSCRTSYGAICERD